MNIDDEFLGYNCTRCNKLIYETDSDFHWFTAFKKMQAVCESGGEKRGIQIMNLDMLTYCRGSVISSW